MSASLNFFAAIFVLLCVFSVIVRDFLSVSTLFWSIIASLSVIFAFSVLKSEIFLLATAFFALITQPVTIFARKYRTQKNFRASLRPLVTCLILNLKSGASLREALKKELKCTKVGTLVDLNIQKLIASLENQVFSPMGCARWDDFAQLLLSLDRNPARVHSQLEGFRYRLQTEDKFTARVNQILVQPRLQAGVVLLLYLGLILFVIKSFPPADYQYFLGGSLFAVSAGLLQLFFLGRTYRWKV